MTDPSTQIERIAAFLDGALGDAEQAAFEAELEINPALAAAVERMLGNDSLLRAAFDEPIGEGVDGALLARMGLAAPAAEVIDMASRRLAPSQIANDNSPGWSRWRWPLGGAVAAAVALMVTVGFGSAGTTFDDALDNTPSGQLAALEGSTNLTPVLSFRAGDGRYCREFSLGSGEQGGSGIACRDSGGWEVEALDEGASRTCAQRRDYACRRRRRQRTERRLFPPVRWGSTSGCSGASTDRQWLGKFGIISASGNNPLSLPLSLCPPNTAEHQFRRRSMRRIFPISLFALAVAASLAVPAQARRGADDAADHVRQCRGCDDEPGHVRQGRGADDAPGHVRQGRGTDDAAGNIRRARGADDTPGDARRGRGNDDQPGHN